RSSLPIFPTRRSSDLAALRAVARPDHAVLRGKDRERNERIQLVTRHVPGVGEPGGNLVLPFLSGPHARRRVGEELERPGGTTHIDRKSTRLNSSHGKI